MKILHLDEVKNKWQNSFNPFLINILKLECAECKDVCDIVIDIGGGYLCENCIMDAKALFEIEQNNENIETPQN